MDMNKFVSKNFVRLQMVAASNTHPTGFEPATPALEGQCSIQTELRVHILMTKNRFKRVLGRIKKQIPGIETFRSSLWDTCPGAQKQIPGIAPGISGLQPLALLLGYTCDNYE